jgi:hypothetical protein
METATSTLKLMPNNLGQATSFAASLIQEMENGQVSALDILTHVKCIEKSFELLKDKLMEFAIDEAANYEKSFEYISVKIEKCEVGTKYDFSKCNDFKLAKISAEVDKYSKEKKEREATLKTLKTSIKEVDEETGDIVEIFPPIKTSTSSLKVTLLK